MAPSFADMQLDITGDVARLQLNRPPLNIITIAMIREMAGALARVAAQPKLKAFVLAASGTAFCAGVDVRDHAPDRVEPMIREFGQLCQRLRLLPIPTIAVVQGAALGGGMELVIACDQVLAAASARFGQPEIKLGVFPPFAAALLPRLIGYQQAAHLILSGEVIAAAEAARLGLVTTVVPDTELSAVLERWLTQFRGLSAPVLRLAKKALLLGADRGMPEALPLLEELYLQDLLATQDAREGIQAFLAKRPPVWSDE
jgi:cyclohexa-1,5-dienecarbonyl-CoA hydratase